MVNFLNFSYNKITFSHLRLNIVTTNQQSRLGSSLEEHIMNGQLNGDMDILVCTSSINNQTYPSANVPMAPPPSPCIILWPAIIYHFPIVSPPLPHHQLASFPNSMDGQHDTSPPEPAGLEEHGSDPSSPVTGVVDDKVGSSNPPSKRR